VLLGWRSPAVRRRLVIGLAVLVTLLACAGYFLGGDRAYGSQTIGVYLAGGRPAVLLYSCAGRPVTTLSVAKPDFHAATDEVLWRIERTSAAGDGESMEEIRIGQAPAGYRTVVPLSAPLPSTSLYAIVSRKRLEGVVTFKVADLREGSLRVDPSWFSQHESVDRDRFLRVNRKNC
jgi:hypothetical protein